MSADSVRPSASCFHVHHPIFSLPERVQMAFVSICSGATSESRSKRLDQALAWVSQLWIPCLFPSSRPLPDRACWHFFPMPGSSMQKASLDRNVMILCQWSTQTQVTELCHYSWYGWSQLEVGMDCLVHFPSCCVAHAWLHKGVKVTGLVTQEQHLENNASPALIWHNSITPVPSSSNPNKQQFQTPPLDTLRELFWGKPRSGPRGV